MTEVLTADQKLLEHSEVLLCPGGPMLVRGDHQVLDDEGRSHATTRPVSAVCRCGHSASAPWCDGTHKVARARPHGVTADVDRDGPPGRSMDFGGLSISYDHRVLEPRPWTAGQSLWASSLLPHLPEGPVLEVCAGAGHIGLLAVQRHERALVMVDADPVACFYARHNADATGFSKRVTVRCGRMEDVLEPHERFPLIIADPPWVPSDRVGAFPDDPRHAIDGGGTGLDLVVTCLELVSAHLAPDGAAVLQVGPDGQADAVADHLTRHPGLALVATERRWHARGALVLLRHRD